MNLFDNLRRNAGKRLLIGGHQGHRSGKFRANTIANFELVKGAGLSHIEVDLQMSKDGEIVVYHDFDLSEKTPLSGWIRDYTVDELKRSFEINTLGEVLQWCIENDLPPALEIKCRLLELSGIMPLLAERLAELLNQCRFGDFGFVFGTDYHTLWQLKGLAPKTALGLIVPFVPRNPLHLMEEMGAQVYLCYIDNLSRELVDALHTGGYYVDGSVINNEPRLRCALELGVDLVETDKPRELISLYGSIANK